MLFEFEVRRDPGGEMAGVMRRRRPESRVKFVVRREAPDGVASLEYEHALAGACKVRGTDQAIVACPDYYRIVAIHAYFQTPLPGLPTLDSRAARRIRAYTLGRSRLQGRMQGLVNSVAIS